MAFLQQTARHTSLRSARFDLSRSGIYLRLIPRNVRTIEGKRHRNVAPVKLSRRENSHHKYHLSTKFARASIRYLEEIASFLGPEEVTFHSQDDKAKVPIGIPAAKKHVPLLMHLEYKVQLPDHDFVVAANHKLIPSVIGDMRVMPRKLTGDAVSYNGPTYCNSQRKTHRFQCLSSSGRYEAYPIATRVGIKFQEFEETCDDNYSRWRAG